MARCTVLKIGGSLIPAHARALCLAIKSGGGSGRLVLVAGGGEIADVVRAYRRVLGLTDATTFAMALLSMDQHALLLAELGGFPLAGSIEELASMAEPICVLAPAGDVRRNRWCDDLDVDRVSSDAVAAFIAARIGAALVIATDVDGIYDRNPKLAPGATLLGQVNAGDLGDSTAIDVESAAVIRRFRLEATVLNGTQPQRVADHLAGIEVPHTKVLAEGRGNRDGVARRGAT
ncbi:[5-(aminomethyl)furan-3-yl]methyl phosphate kinase [soil metagenome]